MKMKYKKPLMYSLLAVASLSLFGCSNVKPNQELVAYPKVNSPKPSPYMSNTNNVNLGAKAVAYNPKLSLPKSFEKPVVFNLASYDQMISLKALVKGNAQLKLSINKAAMDQMKAYFNNHGSIMYTGTLKGLLNEVGTVTHTSWKFLQQKNQVTFYVYQTEILSIPKHLLGAVKHIIGNAGDLVHKKGNEYAVTSSNVKLTQVLALVSKN